MNRTLLICVLCIGVWFTACKSSTENSSEALSQQIKKALTLNEKVAVKMSEITDMAELGTVEYTVTKIVQSKDDDKWYKIGDRRVLFSCTAYLKAGIDMSQFDPSNIDIHEESKSVTITLPKAQLLSFNMPPEKCKLEYEKVGFFRSNFTSSDRNQLLKLGEKQIRAGIPEMGIYQEAEAVATLFFRSIFQELGFENITIKFAKL